VNYLFTERNMRDIFSTTERLRILEAVIFKPGPVSVNETASRLALSKGLVSKYLGLMAKAGMAKRHNGRFTIIGDSPLVKGVKVLLNLHRIPAALFKHYPFVKAAGLYGSCAKGENTEESDLDVWIQIDKAEEPAQAALTSELSKSIENARPLLLSKGKLARLKKEDPLFFYALTFGSITVYGERCRSALTAVFSEGSCDPSRPPRTRRPAPSTKPSSGSPRRGMPPRAAPSIPQCRLRTW
jgi:predicted nucleotidyltransferase